MVRLYQGDCLEILPTLEAGSIDAILTDLPYGTTACSWDTVIPFEPMWKAVKRILKPRGVFVTTASQPFTSALVMSNVEWFKYDWIWNKSVTSGYLNSHRRPMRSHEEILVFYSQLPTYHPQLEARPKRDQRRDRPLAAGKPILHKGMYEQGIVRREKNGMGEYRMPKSIISINQDNGISRQNDPTAHPTRKPVALYEYLTLTYTNPGDTVLDICAGSGTTGVACIKTGRNFIGIELREDYFSIMERRIRETQKQGVMNI